MEAAQETVFTAASPGSATADEIKCRVPQVTFDKKLGTMRMFVPCSTPDDKPALMYAKNSEGKIVGHEFLKLENQKRWVENAIRNKGGLYCNFKLALGQSETVTAFAYFGKARTCNTSAPALPCTDSPCAPPPGNWPVVLRGA